jgi:hypothetical protein
MFIENLIKKKKFQMRQRCKEVGLEPTGKREALKRRLKEHFKNEKLIEAGKLVCFDERLSNFAWKLLAYRYRVIFYMCHA